MESLTEVVNSHLGLIIAIAIGAWWVFARVKQTYTMFREFVGHELEERLPSVLKRELQNGLGDLVELRIRKVLEEMKVHRSCSK